MRNRKRNVLGWLTGWLVPLVLFTGCTGGGTAEKYSTHFYGVFDTVVEIQAYAENQESFQRFAESVETRMRELHQLFDIYHTYDGMNNLKTVNDQAGKKPVQVAEEAIDLLSLYSEWYTKTGGAVDPTLGPLLAVWHDYREAYQSDPSQGRVPSEEELEAAAQLCVFSGLEIDPEASTLYLKHPGMRLDVGAAAKGYAAQLAAEESSKEGVFSYLISAGGNIIASGAPCDGRRSKWAVGIQQPFAETAGQYADVLYVTDCAVVTSGDYQRYYVADGKIYGHIIDPTTRMPAEEYHSVTILGEYSGISDLLSTAAFILPYPESRRLVEENGADAIWIFSDGRIEATEGAVQVMRDLG
ncbi:MAG TPA: FAD:protein FMN transferase, partial [Firmicutes bacterium]|nr:FAD:protein FMN transferase [Bacillota bacterium]